MKHVMHCSSFTRESSSPPCGGGKAGGKQQSVPPPLPSPPRGGKNWNKAYVLCSIATCGPVGKSPLAPGTLASVCACPFIFLLSLVERPEAFLAITFILIVLAVWASSAGQEVLGVKDPRAVVIDEVVGMFLTFLFIPVTAGRLAAGFLLFRFFDVLKPPPIRSSERLPGGFGIVADDALAALYANLFLRILISHAGL